MCEFIVITLNLYHTSKVVLPISTKLILSRILKPRQQNKGTYQCSSDLLSVWIDWIDLFISFVSWWHPISLSGPVSIPFGLKSSRQAVFMADFLSFSCQLSITSWERPLFCSLDYYKSLPLSFTRSRATSILGTHCLVYLEWPINICWNNWLINIAQVLYFTDEEGEIKIWLKSQK